MNEITVFSGSAHPELAAEICNYLGVPLQETRLKRFSNDCLEVQLQANCREKDVFIVQTLSAPVQENLVELLLMLDAARGASASRITAVIPHFSYARSDKKDSPRISIGGRLVADLLVTAGRQPRPHHDAAFATGARLLQRPGRSVARPARARRAFPAL
ncbi:ribose-phosphate pyrophosphokinase-like domain-containing protein [Paradevosia shaoguanensis]|uniref:ribose-phosphate pyrophosphokinase-like domain-containing protein n=1 Tax=Paradevosia shaoguanensis TaxID=1335043 RepID=UPI002492BD67|nr:ribose-phosphate pyrophosphokinase-like domain-containing protein [Paradevosia shaoguanensis]